MRHINEFSMAWLKTNLISLLLGILMAAKYVCLGLVVVDPSQLTAIYQIGDRVD
jgi:hypothetical protein